ncbi:uncharacterized protein BXZ73DRAFT_99582 [Epithele typhae]|uniref:uncharacterized protein n=1 Tax=Epithele typhae TaxID=378194 RepID=UPI0020082BAE|nr:uncharacterized protein BXZ73DRAFT_99582 [Epithele typhae]KAH9939379.1 hypothetical protein BXZ73DRAFT_99582 [Epithele typhae]
MASGANITFIDDSDSIVQYEAGWNWEPNVSEVDGTRHRAVIGGLWATLSFAGSGVQVFGTVGASSSYGRPTTEYLIDNKSLATYTAPITNTMRYNVSFFDIQGLPYGTHMLNITNLNGTAPNTFWLDFFFVNKTVTASDSTASVSSSTSSGPATGPTAGVAGNTSASGGHKNIGAIVGGVVGGIAFLALLALVLYCVRKQRRRNTVQPYAGPPPDNLDGDGHLSPAKSPSPSFAPGTALPSLAPSSVAPASSVTPSMPSPLLSPNRYTSTAPSSPQPATPSDIVSLSPQIASASVGVAGAEPLPVPHTEVSRAPWYAPAAEVDRAEVLLHAFSVLHDPDDSDDDRGDRAQYGAASVKGSGASARTATTRMTQTTIASPLRDEDSGLRMYSEPALPPAYTPD